MTSHVDRRGPFGKLSPREMERVVFASLGHPRKEVLRGPGSGFDNSMIELPGRGVMVVTTDPVSVIPSIGMKESAWMSVHLIASDLSTSGVLPEFATFSFNFPQETGTGDRDQYLRSVGKTCSDLGISIVAGHTGAYPGASFTVVGAGTMFGFSRDGRYIDPSMAGPGDAILMTKGAAIEATTSLAWAHGGYLRERIGSGLTEKARKLLKSCSVVADARAASQVGLGRGAVTSMHDATEGGILGALSEMSSASHAAFIVDPGEIIVSEESRAVCGAFGIDPLRSLGEGSLLLTCSPRSVQDIVGAERRAGIRCVQIGRVAKGTGAWIQEGGRRRRVRPGPDRYWDAYDRSPR